VRRSILGSDKEEVNRRYVLECMVDGNKPGAILSIIEVGAVMNRDSLAVVD
jgi:hypothetical protein